MRTDRESMMGASEMLRIGDLAARCGVTVETLRYYERRRLLRPSGRLASGYRVYGADGVGLVHFIKRAQSLGFTLKEVEELVRLRERAWAGDATYLLREAIVAKVRDVEHRMEQLRALGNELNELIAACDNACRPAPATERCDHSAGSVPTESSDAAAAGLDCPLVEMLDTEPEAAPDGRLRVAVRP